MMMPLQNHYFRTAARGENLEDTTIKSDVF